MTDATALSKSRQDLISWVDIEVMSRQMQGYSIKDGYNVTAQGTPDNTVAVAAGNSYFATALVNRAAPGNVTFDACSATLDRIDILYAHSDGTVLIHKGDNFAVSDPLGNSNWKQYTSPYAKASIPAGAIIAQVYILHQAGTVPVIQTAHIWMGAGYSSGGGLSFPSEARGDLAMRGVSVWQRLAAGTAKLPLLSAGSGADLLYAALGRLGLRQSVSGMTPATLAADEDLSGRMHLVYPTNEALELVGGMECVGNTDGSTVKLYFRASSDDDTIFRAATNKAYRVEIEYYDGAGGGSGTITGASNATPVVITDVAHGLVNGQYVYITGLVGPAALNGKLWKVANKADDTFELEGSTASGAYVSGGTWYSGCLRVVMKNAAAADVITPLVVLINSGKWKTARCIADITARCNGDYTGQANADLYLEGDVSGLDLYIRAVRLRQVTNEAAIVWIADSGRPHPVSSPMIRKEASTKLTYLTYTYSSPRAVTVTSFADVDATNLSLPFETEGGLCEVKAAFSGHSPANKSLYFDLAVDGVRVGGSSGSGLVFSTTVDSALALVFTAPGVLSPGAHVLTLQSKVEADTGYVSANVPVYLSVLELKN